jgi:hypothetical protein
MEHTKDMDDLTDRLAKARDNAFYLCERAQAVMDQATELIHQSTLRLQRTSVAPALASEHAVLRFSSPPTRN